jgi:hypothetical protein
MSDTGTEQRLNELLEREREIIKKMNLAMRAGANPQVIGQFDFMLQEVRFAQQDLRQIQKANKSDGFDDYLSIG